MFAERMKKRAEDTAMFTGQDIPAEIDRQLREALDRLQKDIATIEIWAAALSGFCQPVPDYEPSNDNLLLSSWGPDGERA